MSEIAIAARGLRKVYRLYRKPSHRVLDLVGLLPQSRRFFDEHVALHDIDLDIRRGEKVAIIGRNGAGKSTLLKLVTRVVAPTAGTLEVRGETQALLQIGTGFHPELTGRQNVLAYLANFGMTGRTAAKMLDEVIDFAELEEYIDQPTKTYSTGMSMRLMFSASTMFAPDLLVIDEVLGVGDAYFQGKSFERVKEICARQGTTLLLVTHDVHSAASLCERMIWIDQGAVVLDADSPTVLRAYDGSIRQQEEARLRKKALMALEQRRVAASEGQRIPVLIEFRSPNNAPPPAPVHFSRIALFDGEREVGHVALADEGNAAGIVGNLVLESGAWGDLVEWNGRRARRMNNFGSSLQKVAVAFQLPGTLASRTDKLCLEVEFGSDARHDLEVWRIDADMRLHRLGPLDGTPGMWTKFQAQFSGQNAELLILPEQRTVEVAPIVERHGSGRIVVHAAKFINASGQETFQLVHGEPTTLLLDYEINDPDLSELCQAVVAFHRQGVEDVFRLFCNEMRFDRSVKQRGQIVIDIDRLPLGANDYSIAVLVASQHYYDERPTMYFSVNPKVYYAARGLIEFKVVSEWPLAIGTASVGVARWTLC